jgi:NADH-quinone oxidoreductase subunit J
MTITTVAFWVMAVVLVLSAWGVVIARSPVRSALNLVVNFFVLAFLYFGMNYDLLGISQILVYTGLIMMLFLFCILLLNLGAPDTLFEPSLVKRSVAWFVAGVLVLAVSSQVIGPMAVGLDSKPTAPEGFGQAASVGQSLFTGWVYGFEIASVLLLVGIVGSILVAKRRD